MGERERERGRDKCNDKSKSRKSIAKIAYIYFMWPISKYSVEVVCCMVTALMATLHHIANGLLSINHLKMHFPFQLTPNVQYNARTYIYFWLKHAFKMKFKMAKTVFISIIIFLYFFEQNRDIFGQMHFICLINL